jgi:signal transduction histidine kinase/CheY-like chemotaxis protein
MTEARTELAKAARLRLRAVPQRMTALVAMAAVLHLAFAWPLVWLWVSAYALAMIIESELGRTFAERIEAGETPSGRPYVASIAVVSLVYGALSVPLLLFEHARGGEVYGFILLAGGLVNLLIVSRASWAAFLATALPYGAYLLFNPVLGAALGVEGGFNWVGVFGALLLLAHTYAAWRRHRETLLAEAEARAESEARLHQAEAATAAKSAFVAMVSHELRTPLSGVLAAGSVLQKESQSPGAREATAVVVDAGRFMHALLDDLLDLAKLESGKMTTEAIPFDLGDLVWSLERHWSAAADAAGKPLQLTSAMGLPRRVSGDPTRLRQVLNNLLSNAVKFTGPVGVTWKVDVCEGEDGCALTVRVRDTGPGIAPERLDQLFTPFDQADLTIARTHGGTGLGLAVSRELARAMGGELRVESALGQGSTFVLSLPLGQVETPAVAAPQPADDAPAQAEETGRSLRVLVVDDHEINRRTLALLLEPAGVEVTLTGCAEEALATLAFDTFDLVLSDLNMPEMDGFGFTRALRSGAGPNRHTPVLAVTAGEVETELPACLAAGMNGCVGKPIDPRRLYAAVEAVTSGATSDEAGAQETSAA